MSFSLDADDFCAVIGPSGAGKSTLIRCINRLVEPTGGEILLFGEDVLPSAHADLRRLRRGIGMIFQEFNLVEPAVGDGQRALRPAWLHRHRAQPLPGLSAGGHRPGAAPARPRGRCPTTSTSAPTSSRGGQRQRVGIARALDAGARSCCCSTSRPRRSTRRSRAT